MRPQKFRGNVFVANLPKGFSDSELAQAFDRFGMVMGACLARDQATGVTKGHGLVDLAPAGAAEQAVQEMNGVEIGGRKIEARLADPNMALTVFMRPEPGVRSEPGMRGESRREDSRRPAGPRPPVQVEIRRSRRPS
jgi:RNA recognition motif-containing protein